MPGAESEHQPMRHRDYLFLALSCGALFFYGLVGGRPLTMHEAVLPQSAREMLADGDWLVPKCGGRPWLERPPLPQWLTAATGALLGGCDRIWVVRLPAALAGVAAVLAVASIAARWRGRGMGLAAGIMFATCFEVTSYAWLAEQDIYLCALASVAIAVFAGIELGEAAAGNGGGFLGKRSPRVLAFFALVGCANLVKGMFFGPVMVLLPVAAWLLWNADGARILRYVWLPGWLAAAGIGMVWPILVYQRYPSVMDLWLYDHVGRLNGAYAAINQPWWHYLECLPWEIAPWTPLALIGLAAAIGQARQRYSPARFMLSWGVVPIAVFSLAHGEHHHYLLSILGAWGLLSAWGAAGAWNWLLQRGFRTATGEVQTHRAAWALGGIAAATAAIYCVIHSTVLPLRDGCLEDTAFLQQIRARGERPLLVNADIGTMDTFRILFYLDGDAVTLHNLSYLLDERITATRVFVISRDRDRGTLEKLGQVTALTQSVRTRRESSPTDRFTLFQLDFRTDLTRSAVRERVSPMQAAGRADGPFVGRF